MAGSIFGVYYRQQSSIDFAAVRPGAGPTAELHIDSWAMPIAYELWNNGLRLGDLSATMSQATVTLDGEGDLHLLAHGAGDRTSAPRFAWTPTANPWQMEIAHVPLAAVNSLDKDLQLTGGVARQGVVKGTWVERDNGQLGVGSIDVAVLGENGTVALTVGACVISLGNST